MCRYGKLIPYVVSEQRMDDLLSSLCDAVETAVQLMEVLPVSTRAAPQRLLVSITAVCTSFLAIQQWICIPNPPLFTP